MKEPVEYFDTDFLGNKIDIGDKVIFEAPKYRDFVIGTVITKAPKSCQIEYVNDWNYEGRKEIVRQYYSQVIKYPLGKTSKWKIREGAFAKYECLECGSCKTSSSNYCPHCGAKMED